jgi:hypothetical protein
MAPLKPLTTWKASEDNTAISKKEFNGFYDYQAMRHASIEALPPGWKRHSHPEGDFFTDAEFGNNKFQHAYPLPSVHQLQQNITELSPSVLLCTAPVATAFRGPLLHAPLVDESNSTRPWIFSLMYHGIIIGSLVIHEDDDSETKEGRPCELIAISDGELNDIKRACEHPFLSYYLASQGHLFDNVIALPPGHEDRSFYNVLWIERENGVAYRKGLGMVSKRHWSAVDAQMETITLG